MTQSTRPTIVQKQRLNNPYLVLLGYAILVFLCVIIAFLFWAVFGDESFGERFESALLVSFFLVILLNVANLPGESATLEVGDKSTFVSRVNMATSKMGYSFATQMEDFFVYRPSVSWKTSWRVHWFVGPISVYVHDGQAVIVGPKAYVRYLLKRLAEA